MASCVTWRRSVSADEGGIRADTDDMYMICCFIVNSESSNSPKSRTTSTDSTTTEPMEREWLSPVRRRCVDRQPNPFKGNVRLSMPRHNLDCIY